jgi:hypothetical protein
VSAIPKPLAHNGRDLVFKADLQQMLGVSADSMTTQARPGTLTALSPIRFGMAT